MGATENGMNWRKASASMNGNCVEMAHPQDGSVFVRDSKHPDGPRLRFTETEWKCFLIGVKEGEFDIEMG